MIRKVALAALVVWNMTPTFTAPAQAVPADVRRCSLTSVTDVSQGFGEIQVGQLNGGPIGDPAQPTASVTLRCSVHVGNNTHTGAVAASANSATSIGLATLAPTTVSYTLPENASVYVCTEVTVNGTTHYRNSGGTWSTNPAVPCSAGAFRQKVVVGVGGPSGDGRLCSFSSVSDPTIEDGQTQTGQINGGPVVAADLTGPSVDPTASVSLTCTIQVGASNATHAGADSASGTSSGRGFAILEPRPVSYLSPEGQPVYICTEMSVNGNTRYWDGGAGAWSSSEAAACPEAIAQEIFPGPLSPGLDTLDDIERTSTDPIICPILATTFPPEGDIVFPDPIGKVFDCPPYDTSAQRDTSGGDEAQEAAGESVWIVCAGSEDATLCA